MTVEHMDLFTSVEGLARGDDCPVRDLDLELDAQVEMSIAKLEYLLNPEVDQKKKFNLDEYSRVIATDYMAKWNDPELYEGRKATHAEYVIALYMLNPEVNSAELSSVSTRWL